MQTLNILSAFGCEFYELVTVLFLERDLVIPKIKGEQNHPKNQ